MNFTRKQWKAIAFSGWIIAMIPIVSGMLNLSLFPSFSMQSNLLLALGAIVFLTAVIKGNLINSNKRDD